MKCERKVKNTHFKEAWAVNNCRLDNLMCNYQTLNSKYSWVIQNVSEEAIGE